MLRFPSSDCCGDSIIHGRKGPCFHPITLICEGRGLITAKLIGQNSPGTCVVFTSEVAEPATETPRRKVSAQDTVEISSLDIIKHASALMINPSSPVQTTGVQDPASMLRTTARWKRRKELDTVESIQRGRSIGRPPA